jgi:hypothetical protein
MDSPARSPGRFVVVPWAVAGALAACQIAYGLVGVRA